MEELKQELCKMNDTHNLGISNDEIVEFAELICGEKANERRKQLIEEIYVKAGVQCHLIEPNKAWGNSSSLALKNLLETMNNHE